VAARAGVDVVGYSDDAVGEMPDDLMPQRITRIVLRPRVTVSRGADRAVVERMLHEAHEQCYIASSLTTDVVVEPTIEVAPG
jgi:organic hydroperoxide reductase OsmC/OhrA